MNMVFCFSDLAVLYAVTFKACARYCFSCAVRGGLWVLSSLGGHEAEDRGCAEPLGAACSGPGGPFPVPRLPPAHRAEGPPAPVVSLTLGGDASTHKALLLPCSPSRHSACHCTCGVGVRRCIVRKVVACFEWLLWFRFLQSVMGLICHWC